MKRILLLLTLFTSALVFAQEALYISTQTGEYTVIEGTRSISTDDNESGSCNCSSSGPILYEIDPLSIGNDEDITVQGFVHPDPANAPAAGTSMEATITCACSWNWLTWNTATNQKDKAMSGDTTGSRDYTVYSIQIVLPEIMTCDCGFFNLYYTSVFPEGGEVVWDTPWGEETGNGITKEFDPDLIGETVTATYSVGGVSYSATSTLGTQPPPLSVSVGDCDGYKATVTVSADEDCGTIIWSGYGTDNCSGPQCDVDVSPDIANEDQEITITFIDICQDTATETATITMAQLEGFQMPACASAHPDSALYTRELAILDFTDGCEPTVDFDPVELTIPEDVMEHTVTVTATEGDRSFTSQITLVNPKVTIGSDDVNAIVDALGVFSEISDMIDEANSLIGGVTPGFSFEVETTFPTAEQLKESINISFNKNCCQVGGTEQVQEGVKASAGVEGGISVSGSMPIVVPPIPPVIAYVELGLGMSVNAGVSVEGEAACPPLSVCGNITVSSGGSASGSIVILAGLANGTVSADLTLVSGSGKVCVTYAPLAANASGSLTLGGLTLNAQVCAGISFFEHCFPSGGPASVTLWSGYTIQIQ